MKPLLTMSGQLLEPHRLTSWQRTKISTSYSRWPEYGTPAARTVRCASRHEKITTGFLLDPSGRTVTGVQATVDGHEEVTYTADLVVVAAGAVNSAVLLLRSANDSHPNGLANSSDVVGRHYMRHNNLALMAVSKEPNHTSFQKTLALNDWYHHSDDWEFPLGGIQMLGKSDSEQIRANAPHWAGAISPSKPFAEIAEHGVDFWLCGEDLPAPDNRVTLDKDDSIHLALDERNNIEGLKRLRSKLQGMLSELGLEEHLHHHSLYMHKGMPIGATAHQAGTVRFGNDPKTSALDANCKAHDIDNLYVVDTSFFPSIGAVNPSLTAIANALRVGDHLLERLGAARTTVLQTMPLEVLA